MGDFVIHFMPVPNAIGSHPTFGDEPILHLNNSGARIEWTADEDEVHGIFIPWHNIRYIEYKVDDDG